MRYWAYFAIVLILIGVWLFGIAVVPEGIGVFVVTIAAMGGLLSLVIYDAKSA